MQCDLHNLKVVSIKQSHAQQLVLFNAFNELVNLTQKGGVIFGTLK